MLNKSQFRFKVVLCFISLASITFLILYLTGPRKTKGPSIRVLHLSFANHRIVDNKDPETGVVTMISDRPNRSVQIDTEEWDLIKESQLYYQNNIVLECTANFPIVWGYEGYGSPNVTEENVRKAVNFNDTSTYSFISYLNLMPLKEESTGRYFCSGVSEQDQFKTTFVHLFIPGPRIFTIQNDLNIEADISEKLLLPCPVSNPEANVSLTFKDMRISKDYIQSYNPEVGFTLNAKFLEEQDPLGSYYCQDDNQRSGKITIFAKKDSIVQIHPPVSTVHFDPDFDGEFKCEAKENVTLKFRRVKNFNKPVQTLNYSSDYPFSASINLTKSDLMDGSIITCKTIGKSIELHSWTVLLSESQEIEMQKFYYKSETDEYVCCSSGGSSNRPMLNKIDCLSPGECHANQNCLHSQNSIENSIKSSKTTVEKSGCIYYKMEYEKNVSSGLLQCGVDGNLDSYTYFNFKDQTGLIVADFSNDGHQVNENISNSVLEMDQIFRRKYGSGSKIKFKCKGPKYYFASGFVWQIIRFNGLVDFFVGKEYFDGPWIHSQVEFEDPFDDQRQSKKIYCFAPIWNSASDWKFVYKYIPNILD